jgi:PAS domain-containing protein
MAQNQIEVILARQLAGYLSTPVFLVDPEGNLLYYNEPAERILGKRFDETGEMPSEVWGAVFSPTDDDGAPVAHADLPLVVALRERRAIHERLRIRSMDGVVRRIDVTAVPLLAQGDRLLGAMSLFWEVG